MVKYDPITSPECVSCVIHGTLDLFYPLSTRYKPLQDDCPAKSFVVRDRCFLPKSTLIYSVIWNFRKRVIPISIIKLCTMIKWKVSWHCSGHTWNTLNRRTIFFYTKIPPLSACSMSPRKHAAMSGRTRKSKTGRRKENSIQQTRTLRSRQTRNAGPGEPSADVVAIDPHTRSQDTVTIDVPVISSNEITPHLKATSQENVAPISAEFIERLESLPFIRFRCVLIFVKQKLFSFKGSIH